MPPDPQMRWLRLWTDIVSDPKVRLLAFEDRWHYVAVLCMKRSGDLECVESLLERTVAVTLGLVERDASEVKRRLMEVGLVTEKWQPVAWEKRQFVSDYDRTAIERQRRRRKNMRHGSVTRDSHGVVTDVSRVTSRDCHGVVTTPESESESESEQRQSKRARKRASRAPPDFTPDAELARREIPDIDVDREVQKFRDHEFKTPRSDWAAVWRTWIGTCRESGRYARVQPSQISLEERIQENSGWR